MGFINLSEHNFCWLVAFLGILYTPGEIGFCICFFGVDLDTPIMDIYCLIDSLLVFAASVLLMIGIYKEQSKYLLGYIVMVVISIITYYVALIYTLATIMIIMHYEFLVPANFWKAFQLYGLFYVVKHFMQMRTKEKSS